MQANVRNVAGIPLGSNNSSLAAQSFTLLLLIAVGYAWAPQCAFTNYDDPPYIADNAHIADGLSWPTVQWAFTTYEGANWHPVTWLSHALDCQLFGKRPAGHHVVNVILHAANALLLFALLVRMTGRRTASFYVAALFAIHPLHVESVAWMSERKDVLSTLFFFLALHSYVSYATRGGWRHYALLMLWTALGLMSKPMLVTLPPLLLLLDLWPLRRGFRDWGLGISKGQAISASNPQSPIPNPTLPRLLLEKLPLVLLVVADSVVTLYAQHAMGATHMLGDELTLASRLSTAGVAIVSYLGMMLWPVRLAVFYPYVVDRPWMVAIAAWFVVAVISAMTVVAFRRRPYLTIGWFWYLGTLVPVLGFVQVGAQSMADRYTYIPLIGIFWAIVWLVDDVAVALPSTRVAKAVAWTFVLTILTLGTSQQVVYWTSSETLFRRALAATEKNATAHDNLGDALAAQHRFAEAEVEFRATLVIDEHHFHVARDELVKSLKDQNRTDEAINVMRDIVRRDPKDAKARNDLAMMIGPPGNYREAIPLLFEATSLEPSRPEGWENLACALMHCRDPRYRNAPEAVNAALKAVDLTNGKNAAALSILSDAYLEVGDRVHAAETLEQALKISPCDAAMHIRAAKIYRELGRTEEAIRHLSASDEKSK